VNKLALGTAQFGLKYGIANEIGKVKFDNIKKILNFAKDVNIDLIDTAISYGDSEKSIGDTGIKGFRFVSKLPAPTNSCTNINSWIEDEIEFSLNRLGIQSLYGLLIHQPEILLSGVGKKILGALKLIKSKGIIKKIGISIYDPIELEKLLDLFEFDIVQAPLNIIDHRLLSSGWLKKLHKNNIEIHTRSVFLQGLLLLPKNKRSSYFKNWDNLWKIWDEWLNDNQITALEATLRFALSIKEISRVIVGVESKEQLQQIIASSDGNLPTIPSELLIEDLKLLNPSNWDKV
jgi:aryl-alcohol dehydrogenase-like predicted oxidoreductase